MPMARTRPERSAHRYGSGTIFTHLLTDRRSCFTADGFEETCRKLKVEHRTTKPYTPQTNGLVERFNRTGAARGAGHLDR